MQHKTVKIGTAIGLCIVHAEQRQSVQGHIGEFLACLIIDDMGDSQPIRRHLHQDLAPSEDSQQLVPLVEVAQEALRPLRDVARSVEVAVVKRSAGAVDVENKMARAALRAGAPTLDVIANAALFDALRKAEAVVVAKTVRAPPAEHVQ